MLAGRDDAFDLNRLLHPAQAFEHPAEVVDHAELTLNEKRAILASWASDACAIAAAPDLRSNSAGPPVPRLVASFYRLFIAGFKGHEGHALPAAEAAGESACSCARAERGWHPILAMLRQPIETYLKDGWERLTNQIDRMQASRSFDLPR